MKSLVRVMIVSIPVLAYCALNRYPPVSAIDVMLVLGVLYLLGFAVLGAGGMTARIGPQHVLAAAMPWAAAFVFLANGMLDRSDAVTQQTSVVDVNYYLTSWDTITVRSWRPGRQTETFLWGTFKYSGFLYSGTPVILAVHAGAFGIPWIGSLSRAR